MQPRNVRFNLLMALQHREYENWEEDVVKPITDMLRGAAVENDLPRIQAIVSASVGHVVQDSTIRCIVQDRSTDDGVLHWINTYAA